MTGQNPLPRWVALALGVLLVSVASVSVEDAVLRTALVWLGFVPMLWALYGIWLQKTLLEAASLAAAEGTASDAAANAQASVESREASGLPKKTAPVSDATAAPAGVVARTPIEAAQGQAFTGEKGTPEKPEPRQYLALRRLTEQYLKEVRRMNLIAVWGREGTIGRQQALDEIRQIETRMRNLTERMKFAAGKLED